MPETAGEEHPQGHHHRQRRQGGQALDDARLGVTPQRRQHHHLDRPEDLEQQAHGEHEGGTVEAQRVEEGGVERAAAAGAPRHQSPGEADRGRQPPARRVGQLEVGCRQIAGDVGHHDQGENQRQDAVVELG